MRHEYASEHKTVSFMVDEGVDRGAMKRTITILQNRIDECRRFYPWPALIESLERDKARLIARLESMKT